MKISGDDLWEADCREAALALLHRMYISTTAISDVEELTYYQQLLQQQTALIILGGFKSLIFI